MESIEEKRPGYDSMDEEEEEYEVVDEDRPLQIQSVNRMQTQNNSHETTTFKDYNFFSQISQGTQIINVDQNNAEDQILVQTLNNNDIILSDRFNSNQKQ
jgi:hypothetical protein